MDPSRLRLRRKPRKIDIDAKAPDVARRRAAEARNKIEAGLQTLKDVRSPDDLPTLEGLKSLSLESFIQWKGLGNDTLYKTHSDLRVTVDEELRRIRALRLAADIKGRPKKRRWSENTSLRARIRELEALLGARNSDCADLILALESARKEIRQLQTQR